MMFILLKKSASISQIQTDTVTASLPAFCETFSNLLSSTTTHCPSEVSLVHFYDYLPWSQGSAAESAPKKDQQLTKKRRWKETESAWNSLKNLKHWPFGDFDRSSFRWIPDRIGSNSTCNPPFSPTHNFSGIQRTLIQGNLKDVSKEFPGNHKITNPAKLCIQGNFKDMST